MDHIKDLDRLIVSLSTESIYTYSEDALRAYLRNLEKSLVEELSSRNLYTKED